MISELDRIVDLGAGGRYHRALRRLASLCDAAVAAGPGHLEELDRSLHAALDRAGSDAYRIRRLSHLAAGHLRAARRHADRQQLRAAPGSLETSDRSGHHRASAPPLRRRSPARRSGGQAAVTVDA